jgi:acetolactate decarboxylase
MTNAPGHIFLVSPINAILEGLYETPITLTELASHGDFGIGTFNDLDGELLMVDGEIYRLDADGIAHRPAPEVCTPFAGVCHFKPYKYFLYTAIGSLFITYC